VAENKTTSFTRPKLEESMMNTNGVGQDVDPYANTSDRFDRFFWTRLWRLVRPYWVSERRKHAIILITIMTVLSLVTVGMQGILSYVSRDIMNALQNKNAKEFYHLLILFALWIAAFVPVAAFYPYISGLLGIDWREWMTEGFVGKMLRHNVLYFMMRDHKVDNPDQRISQDLNSFTSGALNYSMTVLQSIVTAGMFFGILWSISPWLALCLIGYAIAGTWLTIVIGRKLVVINFNQQRFEADYRFALVRARDNAEAIALYDGARHEGRQLRQRFTPVVNNFKLLILWQRHLALFTNTFDNAAGFLPYFVLAGAYFSGRFELGEFTQAAYAFSMLQGSLSLVVDQFQGLTDYASVVNRLALFEETCESAASSQSGDGSGIEVTEDDAQVAAKNLTLMTPDMTRVLQQDLSFAVGEGESVLVNGPTGAGKTTLMRAIAGLWRFGSGRILRPPSDEIMFMPQKPYLILGTIREQIQYPRSEEVSDEALTEALQEVGLVKVLDQFGFDSEVNWASVLSGGEQQQLAFARLLLNRPRFAILDEATSALDIASEERLYERLRRLPTAFVSIGHRQSLRKFHRRVIEVSIHDETTLKANGSVSTLSNEETHPDNEKTQMGRG